MRQLAFAAATFFLLHRLVSGGPLRRPLAARLGEERFRRLFAFASLACLAWLTVGYWYAHAERAQTLFEPPSRAFAWLWWLLTDAGLLLVVSGAMARNPATAGMQDAVHDPGVVSGILRVTRHPFLWGVTLIALGHMLVRTDPATWMYFGTLLLLALSGTFSIDAKRRVTLGADWERFSRSTSNLPFAALVAGRQPFRPTEIGWRPVFVTAVLILLTMVVHWVVGR